MARQRLNNVSTQLSSAVVGTNPITLAAGAHSCSWSSAPNLPLIGPTDVIAITVEPNTSNAEVIHLHGYTPGSTTASPVTRLAEPVQGGATTAIAHSGVGWDHGPTALFDFKTPASRVFARSNFL